LTQTLKVPAIVKSLVEAGYNPPGMLVDPHARLYQRTYDTCAMLGGLLHGVIARSGGEPAKHSDLSLPFFNFDLNLVLPIAEVLENAIDARSLFEPIGLGFAVKRSAVAGDTPMANISKIYHVIANVAKLEFLSFYEAHIGEVLKYVRHDVTMLPKPWDFARVVRNAISHNVVRIDDQKFVPVRWYGLEYGPAQNGRKIFETDLSLPDLWILMFEMDDARSVVFGEERVPVYKVEGR
jgi:hypothetical protein